MFENKFYWFAVVLCFCIYKPSGVSASLHSDNIVSAHVTDMFRYGEVETSLYTGRLNFSIPIYSLEDPDFNLYITLHYNAEGFKPRKHSGYVGYGWFLEAGGCITREVQNYPDEICKDLPNMNYKAEGMLHFARRKKLNRDDVFNFSKAAYSDCYYTGYSIGDDCQIEVDYMPDIFRFNFNGYHGVFMINNKGIPVIIEGDYVSVDLSDLDDTSSNFSSTVIPQPKISKITVRTKDGYTYVFGGDLSSVEYTVDAVSGQVFVPTIPEYVNGMPKQVEAPAINTWCLTKVTAPNGRTVTYYYKPFKGNSNNKYSNLWEFNEYYDRYSPFYETYLNGISPKYNDYCNKIHYGYSMTKAVVLDSVVVSGAADQRLTVAFDNSVETKKMYANQAYGICPANYQLDGIVVSSSGRTIKSADLSYIYKSNGRGDSNWRFLDCVKISGVGSYKLNYYQTLSYPDLYNKGDGYLSEEADEYGYSIGMEPSQGMLKEVIFPTGGKQTYSYSMHGYNRIRKYRLYGTKDIEMKTESAGGILGGARIQNVKTFDVSGLVETKTYSYGNGIYHDNLYVYGILNTPMNKLPVRYRGNYSLFDTHIGYGMVTETTELTNGEQHKTVYTYSVGDDTYRSVDDADFNHHVPNASLKTKEVYIVLSGMLLYRSRLVNSGKLLGEKIYRGGNDAAIVKSSRFVYNGIPITSAELIPAGSGHLGCTDTIVVFSHYNAAYVAKKLFVYPDVVEQDVTDYYSHENIVLNDNISYVYDSKLRIKKKTSVDSRGMTRFVKYTYPDEIKGTHSTSVKPDPYVLLKRDHRIGEPVETVSGYDNNGVEYVTSGTLNLYSSGTYVKPSSGDILVMQTDYYPYLSTTMELAQNKEITDYVPLTLRDGSPVYDKRYRISCLYEFDLMQRLKLKQPFGKIATYYKWNGIYLQSKKIGNQTFTYEYIPYVGLSSFTDERGITTHYVYDRNGRLTEVYRIHDGKKEILNAYQYHIKTE